MRIISGKYGRRRFDVPTNIKARPTTDFARENIFNVLENLNDFKGIEALDLFAGTGAISFELLSRECSRVVCVEIYPTQYNFIRKVQQQLNDPNLTLSREMCSSSYKAAGNNSTSFLPIRLTICPGWKPCRRKCYREVFWNRVESSFSNIPKTMIFPLTPYSTSTVVTGAWTSRSSARRYNTIRKEPWPNTRSWLLSYARQIP